MSDALLTLRVRIADWHDPRPPGKENHSGERSAIGKRILATASQQLTEEYGEGFALRSRYLDTRIPQLFPDEGIVSALLTQWGGSRAPKGGDA